MADPTARAKSTKHVSDGHLREQASSARAAEPVDTAIAVQKAVGNQAFHRALGSGRPLDPAAREFMEERFGTDFTGVRVHTDAAAAESAGALNADAYTVGSHIVFGDARYAPDTAAGRRTLAHELAHVVQQGKGGPEPELDPDAPHEHAADHAAAQAVAGTGGTVEVAGATAPGVARQLTEAKKPASSVPLDPRMERDYWKLSRQEFASTYGISPDEYQAAVTSKLDAVDAASAEYGRLGPLGFQRLYRVPAQDFETLQKLAAAVRLVRAQAAQEAEAQMPAIDVDRRFRAAQALADYNRTVEAIKSGPGGTTGALVAMARGEHDLGKIAESAEAFGVADVAMQARAGHAPVTPAKKAPATPPSKATHATKIRPSTGRPGATTVSPEISAQVEQGFVEHPPTAAPARQPPLRPVPSSAAAVQARVAFGPLRPGYAQQLGVGPGGQVHHAIELQTISRYPGVFTPQELNSIANMRGVRAELRGRRQFHNSKIREVWDRHYRQLDGEISQRGLRPGTQEYRDYVRAYLTTARAEIDHVYGVLFAENWRVPTAAPRVRVAEPSPRVRIGKDSLESTTPELEEEQAETARKRFLQRLP